MLPKKRLKRKGPPKKRPTPKPRANAASKTKRKKSIGALVDAADLADLDVKTLEAQLSAAKKAREALFNELQDGFKKADLRGASGANGGARISLVTNKSPSIVNRSKLEAYVRKNKAFELFQARVNKQAWLERMDADGKPIPGVETFEKTTIRITRSK